MKTFYMLCCLGVFAAVVTIAGCGSTTPNADIPKEKLAPPATDLGNDPEYAKKFGKKK